MCFHLFASFYAFILYTSRFLIFFLTKKIFLSDILVIDTLRIWENIYLLPFKHDFLSYVSIAVLVHADQDNL